LLATNTASLGLTIAALGGWIELQHLLIRHHGKKESAAARKERAEETANIATSGRYQSSGHCRGMRCDHQDHASELTVERLDRHIHLHRYRARYPSSMARSKEELESRNDQMGHIHGRCKSFVEN
jgi:hypothetical protein